MDRVDQPLGAVGRVVDVAREPLDVERRGRSGVGDFGDPEPVLLVTPIRPTVDLPEEIQGDTCTP